MSRRLRNWLHSYMDFSSYSEAPDMFHFWTGVSTIAGAIRRKVWMDQGYFQWTPNFYIVFVAPPGIVSKSTTANIGMSMLRDVAGIQFGPDVVTWQALVTALAGASEQFLYREEYHTMSAITISSSEFGNLLNPQDREMVDVLVSLWDGQIGVFEKRTKTSGEDKIVNPWINIIACTTPAWIGGNFPEYMIGGGFTSRTIFVYGEQKRHLVAYPASVIPPHFKELRADLVRDLEYIATQIAGEFSLSVEGRRWGEQWYHRHYNNPPPGLDPERFGGYMARKQTHLHKLAMILSLSKRDDLILEPDVLSEANDILSVIENNMHRVFSNINAPEARAANRLLDLIRTQRRIDRGKLYQQVFQTMSFNDFQAGLTGVIQSGRATLHQTGNTVYVTYVPTQSEIDRGEPTNEPDAPAC